jgi:pyruvate formate lyase activating enzyme
LPVKRSCRIVREEGVHLEIVNLVIPGANDSDKDIYNLCKWIHDSLGADVPVHFSRFSPNYKLKDRQPTPSHTLEKAYKTAQSVGLRHVYIGNLPGTSMENTYCHNCKKELIKRTGYTVSDIKIKDGKCTHCGQKIYGIW